LLAAAAAVAAQLFRLARLQLQALAHELARSEAARLALEEDRLALAGGLARMPRGAGALDDVRGALGALGSGVAGLGRERVEAILAQAREEERGLAKQALGQAVEAARRHADARHARDGGGGGEHAAAQP
jgi:hypothetical protein